MGLGRQWQRFDVARACAWLGYGARQARKRVRICWAEWPKAGGAGRRPSGEAEQAVVAGSGGLQCAQGKGENGEGEGLGCLSCWAKREQRKKKKKKLFYFLLLQFKQSLNSSHTTLALQSTKNCAPA